MNEGGNANARRAQPRSGTVIWHGATRKDELLARTMSVDGCLKWERRFCEAAICWTKERCRNCKAMLNIRQR